MSAAGASGRWRLSLLLNSRQPPFGMTLKFVHASLAQGFVLTKVTELFGVLSCDLRAAGLSVLDRSLPSFLSHTLQTAFCGV